MEPQRKFVLYGREICVPEKEFLYYQLFDRLKPLIQKQKNLFMEFYRTSSVESYLKDRMNAVSNALCPVCELAAKILIEQNNFDHTEHSILEETIKTYGHRWENINKELERYSTGINDDLQMNREMRAYNTRNRARSYGYGTLDSYAVAGLKNAATGAMHGLKNSVGNAVDSAGASMQKNSMKKEKQEYIEDALQDILFNPFAIVVRELGLDVPGLNREQTARLENLLRMPVDQAVDTAIALLPYDIREEELYTFLLKTKKDPDGELDGLAKQAGVELAAKREALLLQVFEKLPTETLEETRTSIMRYREELDQYCQPADERLTQLLKKEKEQFTQARTFNGTVYESIEERQEAEKRYEWEKEHFDEIAPEIDRQIDALQLCYTPECCEAAAQLHNALEKRYAGLARTKKMLDLKQFLYLYEQYKKDSENAQKHELSILMVGIAGMVSLCGMLFGIVMEPSAILPRWIIAAGCGFFVYSQVRRFAIGFKGKIARAALETQALFVPSETLEYIGTKNYTLDHKDHAPAQELKMMNILTAVCTAAAVLAIGFSFVLHDVFVPKPGPSTVQTENTGPDDAFYPAYDQAVSQSPAPLREQSTPESRTQSEPVHSEAESKPQEKQKVDLALMPSLNVENTGLYLRAYYYDNDGWTGAHLNKDVNDLFLYADSTVRLGDMLCGVLGDFKWQDSSDPQRDIFVNDMRFTLDGVRYMLRVIDDTGYPRIESYYEAAGEMCPNSDYDTADMIYRICRYYHSFISGTEQYSYPMLIRGDWLSEDGTVELTINATTYGGNLYQIDSVSYSTVGVSITRNSGRIDKRILYLSDENQLDIYENDSPGSLVGSFTRVG